MAIKPVKKYTSETGEYHPHLKKRFEEIFPGCVVLKNDPNVTQGIQDFTILYGPKWATIEAKLNEKERKSPRPNQEHYVETHNGMSYSAFIYPEIEDKIFKELEEHFKK